MGPAAKYARVTMCEGPEDEQSLLELSPSVRYGRPKKAHELPSPWNAECISRLIGLFILLLIAIGFMLHRFPVHMFHDHSHCGKGTEEHHHTFSKAAVASGQLECSQTGTDIMRAGGNAVDAAIATILCQGVVEPYFSGIGGGFVMTIYRNSTKTTTVINAREVAPQAAFSEMYNRSGLSVQSPLFIAVPGELKGIDYVYKKYGGGVSWERLFEPSIKKARDGFKVSGSMEEKIKNKDFIINNKAFCDVYCDSTRKGTKRKGDIVKNLLLAKTLTLIQKNGVDVFYAGEMAKTMVQEIKNNGGILTVEDLKKYKVEEREPIEITLPNAGYTIHAPPLPFGGPVFGAILSIMDKFNLSPEDFEHNETLQWHRTIEAFRHAYGARYLMGDPDFLPDVEKIVQEITSGTFATDRVKKIFDDKTFHNPKYYGAVFYEPTTTSTSHISVLAPNKDCVSVTSTINFHFGARFMSPSTGVVFNNEMDDFSYPNGKKNHDTTMSEFNQIESGKRPLSSMSPVIFFDKTQQPVFIIGAAGGITIPTSIANVMLRLLYFGTDDFDEPFRAKRLHDSLVPDELDYEEGFDAEIVKKLAKIGHNVQPHGKENHVNGIKNHVSHIHAFSDLRNQGAGVDGW